MKTRDFIIMVGLVGSGKSTCASTLAKKYVGCPKYDTYGRADICDIISSDALREELYGDVNDQTHNDEVFQELHKRVRKSLADYHHVIIDATNITIKARKPLLDIFKAFDTTNGNARRDEYNIIAHIMTTPVERCKSQNKNRDRVVPEEVIDRQLYKFEIPFYEEGFDVIEFDGHDDINNSTNYEAPYGDLVDFATNLTKGFNQRTHHHKYTLDKHCEKVWEALDERDAPLMLLTVALVHDIGKVFTGQPKKDGSGDYTYYSHQNVGTYYLMEHFDKWCYDNIEDNVNFLFYVNYHMMPFFIKSEKSAEKWKEIFGEEKYNNLMLFNECDIIGSGNP